MRFKSNLIPLFSIILTLSNPTLLFAQAPSNIVDVYKLALEQDAIIASERAATIVGQEKERQGLSLLLPSITASASSTYLRSKTEYADTTNPIAVNRKNTSPNHGINIQLTLPIFHLTNFNSYTQSKLINNQSKLKHRIAEQDLILRVAKTYFDILSANESLAVAKSQTLAFKENLERAKLTFKVGTATKTDMLEAQARYDLARASELSALNQQAIAEQALARIIDKTPNKLQPLNKKTPLINISPQNMQHWVEAATSSNLSLHLSQLQLNTAKIEIKKLKNDRMPTLDFIASGNRGQQYSSFVGTDSTTTTISVGLQLKAPIYTGGMISSRIREAEALRTQQKYKHKDTKRQIILLTQQAYLTALNGFRQVDALKQATLSSESALTSTRMGMEVGTRTNLDLLNSQQQFFETERDYTVAKYQYLITTLELKAATGHLTVEDITRLNQLLEN